MFANIISNIFNLETGNYASATFVQALAVQALEKVSSVAQSVFPMEFPQIVFPAVLAAGLVFAGTVSITTQVLNRYDDSTKQKKYSDGAHYKGDLANGNAEGQGRLEFRDGTVYEGRWHNDLRHGPSKVIVHNQLVWEGEFINNQAKTDSSNLADLEFLKLLVGQDTHLSNAGYPLGIISDYLIKKGYADLGGALASAYRRLQSTDLDFESREIHKELQNGIPQLSCFQSEGHAMGLNMVHDPFSKFAILEIFNSSEGLWEFHESHPDQKNKFQTMLSVQVPIEELTPEEIAQLLNDENFKTAGDAYRKVKSIPGAKVIRQDPKSAVWQTEQKADNCSLEWIFAFLRNKMPRAEYDLMRKELFSECLNRCANKKGRQFGRIRGILKSKIRKRIQKLQASAKPISSMDGLQVC